MGEDSLWMRRSGAETWSARMKRMLGLRASEQEEGGEDVEDAVEAGGLWRKSISHETLHRVIQVELAMGLAIARRV